MTGFWPIFFLLVVLKIPVLGSIWLVWWASKQPDEPEPAVGEEDGGFERRPRPKVPRGPRRGPHGGGAALPVPPCPPGGRTRVVKPAAQPALTGRARRDPAPLDPASKALLSTSGLQRRLANP